MWATALVVVVALLPVVTPQYPQQTTPSPRIWHYNDYPDPWWFPGKCNRDNNSAICDPNMIISKADANEIDRLIESVATDTRCPCYQCMSNQRGYIIRVALMPQMIAQINDTKPIMGPLKNARLFAYQLTKRWHLSGNCNETMLIVFSQDDKALYTQTGKQTMKLLTNDLVKEISVDVRSDFDDEETVARGLKTMIKRYRDVLLKTYVRPVPGGVAASRDERGRGGAGLVTWSPVLLILAVLAVIS